MEKRQQPRYQISLSISFCSEKGGVAAEGQSLNISRGGACFTTKNREEPGTQLRVTFSDLRPPLELYAVVSWCRRIRLHHEIGVSFSKNNPESCEAILDQVRTILAHKQSLIDAGRKKVSDRDAASDYFTGNSPSA